MENTINDVMRTTTLDFIAKLNPNQPPTPASIEASLIDSVNTTIAGINKNSPQVKLNSIKKLAPWQIATIVAYLHPIKAICTGGAGSDRSYDLLALYQNTGENEGIYVTDDETFRGLIRQYNITIQTKEINEVMSILKEIVPRSYRCKQANLIAVNNGVFDYDAKKLLPFSPDLVFLSKSRINYVKNVTNPIIHNPDDNTDWDVESWMKELSDDPEIVNLLWEILGAIVRPLVAWNKSAWFYSESGNNGKGTLCELMRQLVGPGSYASIPLSKMGEEFALEPLVRSSAIIVDENDVGTFIDKAANLKAIITNDVVPINRKFKMPIAYQFYGFMVQCLNEMPKVKDKSDSFFRRQIFIPFLKSFTGHERRYIKNDYLHRQEVLEYVLHRVLHMNYYELSEPDACKIALAEYKEYNDPVRQFADEVLPQSNWDLLPFPYLYALYTEWFKRSAPSGKVQSRNTFINDLLAVIEHDPDWECKDKRKQIRGGKHMVAQEPLLATYDLRDWMNPRYAHVASARIEDKCTPMAGQYDQRLFRGLIRKNTKYTTEEDTPPTQQTEE